ncbi:MAG TPA: hypothetical protein QF753_22495 [Victivallales bacterium]|nr:hypothetical protein [Victivallales bacterium]
MKKNISKTLYLLPIIFFLAALTGCSSLNVNDESDGKTLVSIPCTVNNKPDRIYAVYGEYADSFPLITYDNKIIDLDSLAQANRTKNIVKLSQTGNDTVTIKTKDWNKFYNYLMHNYS